MGQRLFTVQGRGRFPVDMLRYDGCYPASSADAQIIEETIRGDRTGLQQVQLGTHNGKPTADRWRSFGWTVVKDA